ncbi:hypothetical protein H105_02415 [Trichophyton soudanense CBS 452.61]|uniref:Uncharacterized protein n=1 Tax=Trichophyton soudanense CBS 452.61 TaxID=1215331 RepID=A0A022Y0Y4_TRISD|nr:hypothetical protein H105_02415 [Trichophyton soudanense CBS 452.61]
MGKSRTGQRLRCKSEPSDCSLARPLLPFPQIPVGADYLGRDICPMIPSNARRLAVGSPRTHSKNGVSRDIERRLEQSTSRLLGLVRVPAVVPLTSLPVVTANDCRRLRYQAVIAEAEGGREEALQIDTAAYAP